FLAYLQLPRFQPYMAKAWSDRAESHRFPAHLNADYSAATLLPAVNADQELVRDYLKHFLAGAANTAEFEPYVDGTWLSHRYAEPPLRRVGRTFEFPQLSRPGVYVIDFIGSGKSSRALVRKGRLRPVVTTGTAGLNVTVVDEKNAPVPDAVVWLGGVDYRCDKDGRAVVPFSAQPGRRPVVLGRGEFCCLDTID